MIEGIKTEGQRTCELCGNPIPVTAEFCPVCVLRSALQPEETASLARAEPSEPKTRFEHFELVLQDRKPFELGRGAMGITYKAIDTNLGCMVALKVINGRYLDDERMRQRFVGEAQAAANLRHPNVASVFHLGKTGEDYFYAMELVPGEPLDRILRFRGPLEVGLALEIVDQVAGALSAAYRNGLIHRDIKPANLMVVFGERGKVGVKVIDFGLAKRLRLSKTDGESREPGGFVGTPHFASPEQCEGKEADIRSDLYSLGVTLWAMLSGRVPFEGSFYEVIEKHQFELPPFEQLEHVPRPVISLLESLLEKDPSKRPQTPLELQTRLRAVEQELEVERSHGELRPVPKKRGHFWDKRRGFLIALGLIAGLGALFLYFVKENVQPHIDPRSVAVLPFDSVGDDKQNTYFGDGLTSEVIFELSKISDLRVISRDSVLRYKTALIGPKGLAEIGSELGVAAIMEGTVQRIDDRVMVVSILYDAYTGRRLWGDSYDREITDLFAIQADVAENIAAALKVKLSSAERTILQKQPTSNVTAYDLYLQGTALWQLRHKEDNDKAIELFKKAIEIDSKFALAYTGLANAYVERSLRFLESSFWVDSAVDLCHQAIALDANDVRAYTVLTRAYIAKDFPDQAKKSVEKALQLGPNDEEANLLASNLRPVGSSEAYALRRKCYAMDPNDPRHPYFLGFICNVAGDHDLAGKWMQRAIVLEADSQRRKLMESEHLAYRADVQAALVGLKDLPDDLYSYRVNVWELRIACYERLGNWEKVFEICDAESLTASDPSDVLVHEAIALRALGRESEADEKMKRVVDLEGYKLSVNENNVPARVCLAVGTRFFNHVDKACAELRKVFPDVLGVLPLGQNDYLLDSFRSDPEFQQLAKEFEQKSEVARDQIHKIERKY
jgi:eukaryotic-like serine/threonine-protein kinase